MGELKFPQVFSLAVAGDGQMFDPLVERLKERFPDIIIYDRNEEASRPPSDDPFPAIPQVAYVDVLFLQRHAKETATIRCFHRHRFFNYDIKDNTPGSASSDFLLKQMVEAVSDLCELPQSTVVMDEPPSDQEDSR